MVTLAVTCNCGREISISLLRTFINAIQVKICELSNAKLFCNRRCRCRRVIAISNHRFIKMICLGKE